MILVGLIFWTRDDFVYVGDVGALGLDDVSNVVASNPVAADVVQAANDDVIGTNVSLDVVVKMLLLKWGAIIVIW